MNSNLSFSIIGGDLRFVHLANQLSKEGYKVNTLALEYGDLGTEVERKKDLKTAIEYNPYIICPLPFSEDNISLNCPLSDKNIQIYDLITHIVSKQIIFGGFINQEIMDSVKNNNINIIDYYKVNELSILNAVPTAEGAINIAMENTNITLCGSKCLILGFGKISKTLAKMLLGIGAEVWIACRNSEDLAWIKSLGYKGINLYQIKSYISEFEIIFNTIPALVLDKDILLIVNNECILIELASKPGGIDKDFAQEIGLKYVLAQSLPGKIAPKTAAQIIKKVILDLIFNVN